MVKEGTNQLRETVTKALVANDEGMSKEIFRLGKEQLTTKALIQKVVMRAMKDGRERSANYV